MPVLRFGSRVERFGMVSVDHQCISELVADGQTGQFKNNHFTEINLRTTTLQKPLHSGSEAGSYVRLVDSCITQLKARGPSRSCNESKEEKEKTGLGCKV